MFAPMITATDCARVISPAVTKPTTRTVVTVDELSAPVTNAPVSAPKNRLAVRRVRRVLGASPAARFSPSESWSNPKRKSANPPHKPMASPNQSMLVEAEGGISVNFQTYSLGDLWSRTPAGARSGIGGIPDSKKKGVDRRQKHHRNDGPQREPKHNHDRHRHPEYVAQ